MSAKVARNLLYKRSFLGILAACFHCSCKQLDYDFECTFMRNVFFSLRFVITVRFRSLVPNGVLLYAANDLQMPTHFISLELMNGRLVFKYNAGFRTVRVMSTFSNYSDGGHEYTV